MKSLVYRNAALGVLLCTVLINPACRTPSRVSENERPTDGGPSVGALRAAPQEVQLAGRTYTLEADLWRDFMPPTPPDGRPLIAVLRVKPADGAAVPDALEIERAWVLHEDRTWTATPEPQSAAPDAKQLEATMREGPKWGPDARVDVVVRLKLDDMIVLVRAADQQIQKVQ